jgi:hypothetical protein
MFDKKLNKKDRLELLKREELIRSYRLVVDALETQKRIHLSNILPKYGCELKKNYNIDFQTGKITEVTEQPNQPQK